MKYTATKLKALAKKRQAHLEAFYKLNEKIRSVCTHPRSLCYTTKCSYNGRLAYQDRCGCCNAWIGATYDEFSGGFGTSPHYPLREKI